MNAVGRTSINSMRSQELERNTDILSIGSISPATGLGDSIPHGEGPDFKVKAWVRLDFKVINC